MSRQLTDAQLDEYLTEAVWDSVVWGTKLPQWAQEHIAMTATIKFEHAVHEANEGALRDSLLAWRRRSEQKQFQK